MHCRGCCHQQNHWSSAGILTFELPSMCPLSPSIGVGSTQPRPLHTMGVQSPSDCPHARLSSNFPNIIPTISISSSTHLLVPEFSFQVCTQKFLHLLACGICPRPGVEPVSPALAGGFLITEPPGKSLSLSFDRCIQSRPCTTAETWNVFTSPQIWIKN